MDEFLFDEAAAAMFVENGVSCFTGRVTGMAFRSDLVDMVEDLSPEHLMFVRSQITCAALLRRDLSPDLVLKILRCVWGGEPQLDREFSK